MLLSYRVVACSSEDEQHPARELQHYSTSSRGWQSERFCKFPQELVLRFQGRVVLHQVQVLSHQFKIPSRVELFVGSLPVGVHAPAIGCDGVSFSRLGHFSLDSNERSKFQVSYVHPLMLRWLRKAELACESLEAEMRESLV